LNVFIIIQLNICLYFILLFPFCLYKFSIKNSAVLNIVFIEGFNDLFRFTCFFSNLAIRDEAIRNFLRHYFLDPDPKDDSILINRIGTLFFHTLEYLRADLLWIDVLNNKSLRQSLIIEVKYFDLHKLIGILSNAKRMGIFFSSRISQKKTKEKTQ
jgi:hypothetical protein